MDKKQQGYTIQRFETIVSLGVATDRKLDRFPDAFDRLERNFRELKYVTNWLFLTNQNEFKSIAIESWTIERIRSLYHLLRELCFTFRETIHITLLHQKYRNLNFSSILFRKGK